MQNDDFLTQEEIDALLSNINDTDDEVEETAEALETAPSLADTRELSDLERDALAEVGNISMGSAATPLSTLVNRRVWITVPEVRLVTMDQVVDEYPVPCVIVRVEYIQGLQGANLLIIKERDAAVIADLMLGNDGTNPPSELDELSLSAMEEAMNQMMGAAATAMSNMFEQRIDISPPVTIYEAVASSQQLAGVSEPLIQVRFRIEIEDLVDSELVQLIDYDFGRKMVQMLMPGSDDVAATQMAQVVEPDIEESISFPSTEEPQTTDSGSPFAEVGGVTAWQPPQMPEPELPLNNVNIQLIRNIPVNVRAILGRTRMPIADILRLSHGSLIELDRLDGEPVEVLANDTLIAKGEVVVVGEQFGIRITEIANHTERIRTVEL
ncbi:MAG: flagellar motor switch phosphatase FliY [Firmicutes bacterium]|nr:flagellar motor switch phosphatase FliY [Bacillota bacterium]